MTGLLRHFLLTLRLNLRSKQALVYGYIVPIFFLLAFGSVFRSTVPPLTREMGQLLTISILGGACFGLPTAIVAERERGVWRRYRLLPVRTGWFLASTMAARFFIILSAGLMQIVLARLIYGTPFPIHSLQLFAAFAVVVFSFLGLGSMIASLANDVPAVQALGQCVFLPMIMIGGVGVPLAVLPVWAQSLAGFMPGRYAVTAMQACIVGNGLSHVRFDLIALVIIGLAAFVSGAMLFRWDAQQRVHRGKLVWVAVALAAWAGVGLIAEATGKLKPQVAVTSGPSESWQLITAEQIASVRFDDLPPDDGTVTPLASTVGDTTGRMGDLIAMLKAWPPGNVASSEARVRSLLNAAAIADVTEDPLEARFARAVFDQLRGQFSTDDLQKILTSIIFNPQAGTVATSAEELSFDGVVREDVARKRISIYATKFLRLLRT